MINHETELKLQAHLDSELSSSEAKSVAELLNGNAEARQLLEELKATKAVLADNGLEVNLPETREFYWSKIARAIEREDAATKTGSDPVENVWLYRFLAPIGALAVLAILVAVSLQTPRNLIFASDENHEIETPLEETSSFSFRSEATAMTVVWVDSHRE